MIESNRMALKAMLLALIEKRIEQYLFSFMRSIIKKGIKIVIFYQSFY